MRTYQDILDEMRKGRRVFCDGAFTYFEGDPAEIISREIMQELFNMGLVEADFIGSGMQEITAIYDLSEDHTTVENFVEVLKSECRE